MAKAKKRAKKKKNPTSPTVLLERTRKRLERERAKNKDLEKKLRARNPPRPPARWFETCLAALEQKDRGVRDPKAVCGATWWKLPPKTREAVVRKYARGNPRERGAARALCRAELARAGVRSNPGKRLVSLTYREQKPGDDKEYDYEHEFSRRLPKLATRRGKLQIRGGAYTIKDGWIHG